MSPTVRALRLTEKKSFFFSDLKSSFLFSDRRKFFFEQGGTLKIKEPKESLPERRLPSERFLSVTAGIFPAGLTVQGKSQTMLSLTSVL